MGADSHCQEFGSPSESDQPESTLGLPSAAEASLANQAGARGREMEAGAARQADGNENRQTKSWQ